MQEELIEKFVSDLIEDTKADKVKWEVDRFSNISCKYKKLELLIVREAYTNISKLYYIYNKQFIFPHRVLVERSLRIEDFASFLVKQKKERETIKAEENRNKKHLRLLQKIKRIYNV